jgi:hypothetical protein
MVDLAGGRLSRSKRVAQLAQQAVCEAQETLERLSRQISFGVLKLASAFSRTCCQLAAKYISFAATQRHVLRMSTPDI